KMSQSVTFDPAVVARILPSGDNAILIGWSSPMMVFNSLRDFTSKIFTSPTHPIATLFPSNENSMLLTFTSCLLITVSVQAVTSHNENILIEPPAKVFPSGEKATQVKALFPKPFRSIQLVVSHIVTE